MIVISFGLCGVSVYWGSYFQICLGVVTITVGKTNVIDISNDLL